MGKFSEESNDKYVAARKEAMRQLGASKVWNFSEIKLAVNSSVTAKQLDMPEASAVVYGWSFYDRNDAMAVLSSIFEYMERQEKREFSELISE